jgi:hypothetical protein
MTTPEFSEEIRAFFHSVYGGNPENLKILSTKLLEKGLNYVEILLLTTRELKISLGDAIMLLDVPDYLGDDDRDD